MKIVPRNKQLRGLLLGGAALSAVMAGPILVDATAQALPTAGTCLSGGVCLTSSQPTATATSTTTQTLTQFQTTTVPTTTTVTQTAPPVTSTATVTRTVTSGPTTTTTVTTTVFPSRGFGGPAVRADATTTSLATTSSQTTGSATTGSACGTPGTTTSLGNGEVETCGPNFGHVAVYATTPGVYNKIFDNTSSYYVSAGIFAPQFRWGFLDGCYYVPDSSSVASPGQTVTATDGVLTNAVAFGLHSYDVSGPIPVPRSDCGGSRPLTGPQPGPGQPGVRR
jgi:hypothetical protein